MKSINWKAIAEFLGISAIVASLIFVGYQVQQDARVAQSQVNMASMEAGLATDAAISEHANIWVKAREIQDLSEEEIVILERLVGMAERQAFLGAAATLRIREGSGLYGFTDAPGQILEFAILLHENAGAKMIWSDMADREEEYFETIEANFVKRGFNSAVRDFLSRLQE